MDLVNELNRKLDELSISIKKLRENGNLFAEAERDYRIEISREVLQLRADAYPATLINLVVYGRKSVAEMRFKRDIAEVLYEANKEHINVCKLQVRVIEAQISREWGDPNLGRGS